MISNPHPLFLTLYFLALLAYACAFLPFYLSMYKEQVDNEYRFAVASGAQAVVRCKGDEFTYLWVLLDGTELPRTPSTRAHKKFFPEKFKDQE